MVKLVGMVITTLAQSGVKTFASLLTRRRASNYCRVMK